MKRTLLLVAIVLISCNQNNNSEQQPTENAQAEKERIKSTLVAMWDAIEKGDIERYASYIHPDFTAFGENDSLLSSGKEAEVKGIKSWVERSTPIHTEMQEPEVTIKGSTAWISYYWSDAGRTDGIAFTSSGKSTRIFVKENDKWLCIHGHYTNYPNK